MIEYLSHKLVQFYNSKLCNMFPGDYIAYKCTKCNHIIYDTQYKDHIKKGLHYYWMYKGGGDYTLGTNWFFIKLTCEEEQIKRLLE